MLTYGSVCSGIEAATVAWHPLGWTPAWFSEIEPFPSAVLAHHYPGVPNHGDLRQLLDPAHPVHSGPPIDVLVGGTPCQDFSVAGLRAGIDGARGNLTLDFCRLVGLLRPRWVVWENVPGVLSSDGGRALGAFLGSLAELGYGFAYRVLDAQYFGLAQRRKRVFVVGHSGGDWRRAAQVLLEPEGVRRDSPPRREAGQGTARRAAGGPGGVGARDVATFSVRADAMREGVARTPSADASGRVRLRDPGLGIDAELAPTLDCGQAHGVVTTGGVAHAPRAEGFDASEDGTGRGTPIVLAWPAEVAPSLYARMGDKMGLENQHVDGGAGHFVPTWWDGKQTSTSLMAHGYKQQMPDKNNVFAVCVPVDLVNTRLLPSGVAGTIDATRHARGGGQSILHAGNERAGAAVRRLTPRECERLQGFPDDYTAIPYRGKPAPDGARYKALGNSMAVPVMRWIGQRIALVDALD